MTILIQKIARAGLAAANQHQETKIKEQVSKLGHLMKRIKASDVEINPKLEDILILGPNPDKTQLDSVGLCENEKFAFSMFILRTGAKLPLHDHPQMYGVLKVIYGKVLIESYTSRKESADKKTVETEKLADRFVTEHQDVCFVAPDKGNIHSISTTAGPAVFLDVLFPPYNEDRKPDFYDVMNKSGNIVTLKKVPYPPVTFWAEEPIAKYTGPSLL